MKVYFCSYCGKRTKVKIPKGGDGSLILPIAHNLNGVDVRCPGSWEEPEERNIRIKKSSHVGRGIQ